jgi:hypothetical protein
MKSKSKPVPNRQADRIRETKDHNFQGKALLEHAAARQASLLRKSRSLCRAATLDRRPADL